MIKENEYKIEKIYNITNLNYSINSFRNYINEYLNKYLNEKQVYEICLINIVNFKYYNYIFGYTYGDILINMICSRISECIGIEVCIYRVGGDKLLIIIPINNKDNIKKYIKKIIELVNLPFEIKDKTMSVYTNIGVSIYPNDSKDIEEVLMYADIALNYSRKITKVPYEFFKTHMYENVIKNKKIITNIEYALKNREFILYYQPQIDINTMKVYGMEALLRWNHPELGIISPTYFIDIIEQNGMIFELGKFVLYEACNQMKRLYSMPLDGIKIDKSFVDKIHNFEKEFIITKNIVRLAHELNIEVVRVFENMNKVSCYV